MVNEIILGVLCAAFWVTIVLCVTQLASLQTVTWYSVADKLPEPYQPVLVSGGCAYFDGEYWYTYMERFHPRIQWEVKWWTNLPKVLK